MLPLSIGTSALMQRSSVDLPEPDGPMMQTTPPLGTSIDMPLSTSTSPKDLCTSWSDDDRIGVGFRTWRAFRR